MANDRTDDTPVLTHRVPPRTPAPADDRVPFDSAELDDGEGSFGDPTEDGEELSDLDALRRELERDEKEVALGAFPPVTFASPGRPGYALRFRTDLDEETLKKGRAEARKGNRASRRAQAIGADAPMDQLRFNLWMLQTYNEAILRDGAEVLDAQGRVVRFATREFLDITGTTTVVDAIRKWFANQDGAIIGMGQAISDASSYGREPEDGEVEVTSPTRLA